MKKRVGIVFGLVIVKGVTVNLHYLPFSSLSIWTFSGTFVPLCKLIGIGCLFCVLLQLLVG